MSARIELLGDSQLSAAARSALARTRETLGVVPNLHRSLAHSPAALNAFIDSTEALATGALAPTLREQIALAMAGVNGCEYCASAHSALGESAGLHPGELEQNLEGGSGDAKTLTALRFARELIDRRGRVSDAKLSAVRDAGFTEAEIVEIVSHVALNMFTNMFNELAQTPIDFPKVELGGIA